MIVTPDYAPLDDVAQEVLLRALWGHARDRHAAYPQYEGHFDGWALYVITRDTRMRSGATFPAGRVVMANPNLNITEGVPVTRVAYDPITSHLCGIPHEHIRALS